METGILNIESELSSFHHLETAALKLCLSHPMYKLLQTNLFIVLF